MSDKVCCVRGCYRTDMAAKGMCWRHYRYWRQHGHTDIPPRPIVCCVPHCGKPIHASGFCHFHYSRKIKGISFEQPKYLKNERPPICRVGNCEREARVQGYCDTHYARLQKGQPLDEPIKTHYRKHVGCDVEGCDREYYARGLCRNHYIFWNRTGYRSWQERDMAREAEMQY